MLCCVITLTQQERRHLEKEKLMQWKKCSKEFYSLLFFFPYLQRCYTSEQSNRGFYNTSTTYVLIYVITFCAFILFTLLFVLFFTFTELIHLLLRHFD